MNGNTFPPWSEAGDLTSNPQVSETKLKPHLAWTTRPMCLRGGCWEGESCRGCFILAYLGRRVHQTVRGEAMGPINPHKPNSSWTTSSNKPRFIASWFCVSTQNKIKQGFWWKMWLLLMKVQSSNTQQIGQDLSHTSQTLPCVQWAYWLRVLLDFKPSTFFLCSYCICKISTSRLIAQFSVFVAQGRLWIWQGPGYQSAQARPIRV